MDCFFPTTVSSVSDNFFPASHWESVCFRSYRIGVKTSLKSSTKMTSLNSWRGYSWRKLSSWKSVPIALWTKLCLKQEGDTNRGLKLTSLALLSFIQPLILPFSTLESRASQGKRERNCIAWHLRRQRQLRPHKPTHPNKTNNFLWRVKLKRALGINETLN